MNKKTYFYSLLSMLLLAGVVYLSSCKKDSFINPYEDPELQAPITNPDLSSLDPSNFAYLHAKIFKPTCANSGCHDGTFFPDFRTINSAYNTLVYQLALNGPKDTFKLRVRPYFSDSSMIYQRLSTYFPGTQGVMPLAIDPNSDWPQRKTDYMQALKNWINAGAKDMFGNYPSSGNKQPQVTGFLSFDSGTTTGAYSRGGSDQPFSIPGSTTSTDLWFVLLDDSTQSANLGNTEVKISTDLYDFSNAVSVPLTYNAGGPNGPDFSNQNTTFTHKATIDVSGYLTNSYIYVRVYIDDGDQGALTEVPNAGTGDIQRTYFSLKKQ